MKTHFFPATVLISSVLLLATTGCPGKNEPKVAQTSPTPPATARAETAPPPLPTLPSPAPGPHAADPVAEMANALANATVDQHEGISAQKLDIRFTPLDQQYPAVVPQCIQTQAAHVLGSAQAIQVGMCNRRAGLELLDQSEGRARDQGQLGGTNVLRP